MRYKLRATRAIALIIFLLVILYRLLAEHIPSVKSNDGNPYYGLPTSATTVRPAFSDSMQSFWNHWRKIFYEHRPRAKPILLRSNAPMMSIWSVPSGPREPPKNRVLNSESDVESLRASHAALLETLQSEVFARDMFNGAGVVIMGGGEYFGPAVIGLHMLRKTGSTLPVEIFVADDSEYEPGLCEDYLPGFGARCVVLSHFLRGTGKSQSFEVKHFQLKSFAMLFSTFAEVLYLDSDSIPLVDPSTDLFSTEPYKSSGLVIWPDFWVATESPLFYTIAGLPAFPSGIPKSSSEAGQLLINKKTHLKTLLLSLYYNIYGPDFYYPLLSQGAMGQGDKETFMAAALVLGESYYYIKTGVASVGRHNGGKYKGSAMVQHHPPDDLLHAGTQNSTEISEESHAVVRPAFIHANAPKMNAGHLVDEGDLFSVDNKRLRLWGDREGQENRFGYDLEKAVWWFLLKTGCELQQVIPEWKGRKGMCGKLKDHWKEVFQSS